MQRVLITGGGGYVGSLLVPTLLRQGYVVRVLDWFIYAPDIFSSFALNPHLELIRGDIRDPFTVKKSVEQVDAIIHLAAISDDPSCELAPELTQQVNVDALSFLIEAAQQAGVQRFIFSSSASVYGNPEKVVTEEDALAPKSLYAQSKVEGEALVKAANCPDFIAVIVRSATLCGYAPRLRLDLVPNTFISHALYEGKITVFGGEQQRPILAVKDMVDALICMLAAPAKKVGGEIFNISAANYQILEIAHHVIAVAEREVEIEIVQAIHPRSCAISSEKILQQLGFRPKYSLAQAIGEIKEAFEEGHILHPQSPKYYNVRFLQQSTVIQGETDEGSICSVGPSKR